jgi:protein-disulfide isomerase
MPMSPSGFRFRAAASQVLWLCLALSCERPSAQPPTGVAAGTEIDLSQPPPAEPEPPALRPCKIDDTSCSTIKPPGDPEDQPELDPNRRYAVEISPTDPTDGPADAPVTLVVFSDFQCPFCRKLTLILTELRLDYGDELRVVWKDLPLSHMHPHALPAALLAREAYAKGGSQAFWRVHDALFNAQPEFSDERLGRLAERFELSWPPLSQHQSAIDRTYEQVQALNIRSTPTTFVNGRPIIGAQPSSVFEDIIDEELRAQPTWQPLPRGARHGLGR